MAFLKNKLSKSTKKLRKKSYTQLMEIVFKLDKKTKKKTGSSINEKPFKHDKKNEEKNQLFIIL